MLNKYHSAIAGDIVLNIARLGSEGNEARLAELRLLEIFCPVGGYPAEMFVRYLEENENFCVQEIANTDPATSEPGERGQVLSVHLVRTDGLRVHVIVSSHATATLPLPFTDGTHTMNILTGNAIIVVYPKLTIRGHACINPMAENTTQALAKAVSQNLQPQPFADNIAALRSASGQDPFYCPHSARMIGDKGCLVVVFSVVEQHVIQRRYHQTTRWILGGDPCHCCNRSSECSVIVQRFVYHTVQGLYVPSTTVTDHRS